MKQLYKKIVLWVLVVLDVAMIFSFSLQNADQSTVLGRGITDKIKTEEEIRDSLLQEKNADGSAMYSDPDAEVMADKEYDLLETIIRKTTHFLSFVLFGTLANLLIGLYNVKGLKRLKLCVLIAGIVAATDETIQLFVPGRAGRITDVLIDMSGAFIAAIFFVVGGVMYEKNKKRRLKMDS